MSDSAGGDGEVSPGERAHQRRRDRKRVTRMVVDNAGMRRVLAAVRRRDTGRDQRNARPSDADRRSGD